MKRLTLILIIFILVLAATGLVESVEETTILDGWVRYDHSFTYNDKLYSIATLQTGDMNHPEDGRIAIRAPNGTEILNYGECKETEIYKYCFENVTFEGDYIDIDDQGQSQPGLKLNLIEFDYQVLLEITKWFEKTSFNLYDTGDVAITIENTGDQILKDVIIKDTLPEGFEIYSTNNMVKMNSSTVQTGPIIIYPDKTWTGRYTLKASNYSEGSFATEVKYVSEDGTKKEQVSSSKKISVKEPYKIIVSEIKNSYDSGEDVIFNIKIENNENEKMFIEEFDIYTPQNMNVISTNDLTKGINNHFTYSGFIDANAVEEFEVKMEPLYTGRYSLSYYLKFELKDKEYVVSKRIPFLIQTEGLSCYFETEETNFEAGNIFDFDVVIDNTDDENYYEIIGEVINPFGDNIFINKTNLEKGKIYLEKFEKVIFPITSEDQTYTLEMNAKYRSLELEEFVCESSFPITVLGKDKYIGVTLKAPDQTMARPGTEFDLTFLIENLIDKEFTDIYLEHELSENVSSTGFSRKQFDNLGAKETVEAYSTKVRLPESFDKNYFEVILKVGASNPKYENSVIIEIPVNTSKEEISEKSSDESKADESKNSDSGSNTKSTNQEDGFVDKVINFFVKLFKGNK